MSLVMDVQTKMMVLLLRFFLCKLFKSALIKQNPKVETVQGTDSGSCFTSSGVINLCLEGALMRLYSEVATALHTGTEAQLFSRLLPFLFGTKRTYLFYTIFTLSAQCNKTVFFCFPMFMFFNSLITQSGRCYHLLSLTSPSVYVFKKGTSLFLKSLFIYSFFVF